MKTKIKFIFLTGLPVALTAFLFVVVFAWAWVEPTQGPPNGNVPAPINTGPSSQIKDGPLALNAAGVNATGLIVNNDAYFMGGNIGIGTTTIDLKLNLDNDGGIIARGTFGSGNVLTASGEGTRLIWYPRKAAFRAGTISGAMVDYWDDANIGNYSAAFGINVKASGQSSVAMGAAAKATGGWSTAMGLATTASGNFSTAMGVGTKASGEFSTAMGNNTTASGKLSIAAGQKTVASGMISTALGEDTIASGIYSLAIGRGIEARGDYSIAIALNNQFRTVVSQNNTMAIMGGNVGIGTTGPSEKLEVNGNVKIKKDLEVNGIIKNLGVSNPLWHYVNNAGTPHYCYLSYKKCKYDNRDSCCTLGGVSLPNGAIIGVPTGGCSDWRGSVLADTPWGWTATESGSKAARARCIRSGDSMTTSWNMVDKNNEYQVWCCFSY